MISLKKNNFNKYSIGISFDSKQNFLNILNYISGQKSLDFNTHQIESSLSFFKANFNYMNNHILYDDYDKLYNSYLDRENVFTFFSDGILLYKNLRDINFNLLPKSDYLWDTNKGQFINNYEFTNTSFFGFSAYINNIDNIGFLCFLTDAEIRNKTFKNFNIQLSPLSINEINEKDIINSTHKYLLQNKNKNISSIDLENSNKETNLMFQYFFDEIKYKQLIEDTNYLSN